MDDSLEKEIQDSLEERAYLEQQLAERDKKDLRIISRFCAANDAADMYHTLELLNKYPGMPSHDKKTVNEIGKSSREGKLTVKLIAKYNDIINLYSRYLESGGEG